MSKEYIFLVLFWMFFGGCLAAGIIERAIQRVRFIRQAKDFRRRAAERKWRADFFERYRKIAPWEDKL